MVEGLAKEKESLLERVITIKPTPRVERLREVFLQLKPVFEISRARIYTRVMKETDGEPIVIRRAKAFCALVRELPINIAPDELFVGQVNVTWAGQQVSPESGAPMEEVLDYKGDREFILSEEDERELREKIIPYWKGPEGNWSRVRGVYSYKLVPGDKYYQIEPTRDGKCTTRKPNTGAVHYGHECVNYEKVLKKGFLGVQKDAEERLARLDYANADELRKVPFLTGVMMAVKAASEIGKRFAAKARELAEKEENPIRKAELLKIAETCDWVPANPARTFYEALQSFWFTFILQYWETIETKGTSVGRMDQYLYPYYERDIKEGRLTREEAQELIDCWILKLQNPEWNYRDGHYYVIGGRLGAHISVGGYKSNGNDGTNELSYMFIEALMHVRLPEPHFTVQIHSKVSDDFLIKGCQLCSLGLGHPEFENADVLVPGLLTRATGGPPITMEDARGYTSCGCQEPNTVGTDGLKLSGIPISAAAALEFALNNGVGRLSHEKLGLETGDPRQFKSSEELQEAYKKQFALLIKKATINSNITELDLAQNHPTLLHSALIEDCIEKGMSREEGGARYNAGPGHFAVGLPDVADSLAAVKKLVFEDKKITMAQLCDALDSNFEGCEDIRQMLLKVPKFGNDDDYVDEQMVWLAHEWAVECRKQRNTRGGYGVPGLQAYTSYVPYGKVLGALPSGRLAGKPLSDGASPCPGSDVKGPTAVLKSLSKINNFEQNMTDIVNMTLDPAIFKDEDGFKRMANFLRTLVDQKVQEIQFNVVSPDTLRAAQKEPDKYRGLLVKVCGYCAFFVDLTEDLQNGIIARTMHGLY